MKKHFLNIVFALLLTLNSSFLFAVCNANYNYHETSPLYVEFLNFSVSYNEGTVHYYWDFGDGSTSYQENPIHIYDAPGIYEASLTVITTELCFSSKTKNLYIGIPPSSPYCYLDIEFTTSNATAPDYNNGTASVFGYSDIPCCYQAFWSNGAEGEYIENLAPGTYCVSLTNGETCYGTNCVTIGYNNNCSSSFYIDSTTFSHLDGAYRFINNSHGEQHHFLWDFGDGTTSSAYNPLHIYQDIGTYNVCLTIETHYDCTDIFCRTLHVNYISPTLANLYGIVNAGETLLPQGIAVLYEYANQKYTAIDYGYVENGYYSFDSLPKDFLYLTHIIPYFDINEIYFPKYTPTYFDNNTYWQQTSFINLYNDTVYNTSLYSYNDIYFNQGIISGIVTYEDSISYEESIFHNIWFELTESNEGYAKNMVVLLKNSNHLLLDFKLTDE
ncbi:MAG: PKD domain-containing protein, partial [Bacteroidales bacterium]|nr:PKD domain-containing protein [Bacteroidales bacterium]